MEGAFLFMKDAYYFPHDSNAHKDPKILGLRLKCGWEGVGLFWALIEILRDSTGYKYTSDLATLELGLSTPQATLQATLKACIELGLFVEKDGFFSSPALDRRMIEIDRKREALRDAGRRGGIKSSQAQARLKPGLSHPQAGKESKGKESKGKDINTPLTPQGVIIPEDLLGSSLEIHDWLEYKRQKGQSYKPKGLESLWLRFRAIPKDKRRETVDHSMANNWSGLYEKNGGQQNGKQNRGAEIIKGKYAEFEQS